MMKTGCPPGHHMRKDGKCYKTYYHVTTKEKLSSIKKKGLRVNNKKNVPLSRRVNYVMGDYFHAGQFASQMRYNGAETLVLHLDLDEKKLIQDTNPKAIKDVWLEHHGDIQPGRIIKTEKWTREKVNENGRKLDELCRKGKKETMYL